MSSDAGTWLSSDVGKFDPSGGKAQQQAAFRYRSPPSDAAHSSPPSISEDAARPRQVRIFAWSKDKAWLTAGLSAMEELMVLMIGRKFW